MRDLKLYKSTIAELVAKGKMTPERAKTEIALLGDGTGACSAYVDVAVALKTEWKHLAKALCDFHACRSK